MFHVKRKTLSFFLGLAVLGVFVAGCGGAAGTRGWAAPASAGNILLVSTAPGRLDGLNAQTRQQLWRFNDFWHIEDSGARKLRGIYGQPVVSSDGLTVFFGDYNGYVYAFRPSDVKFQEFDRDSDKPKAASFKLGGPVIGGLALGSDGVLFVTAGEVLYKLQSAQLAARIANKDAPMDVARLFEAAGEIWSQPLLANGNVYISSLDGNMYAINQNTGAELWRFTGERSLASTPALASDTLLVGGFDRRLHAVDLDTGRSKWSFEATDWVWSRPAIEGSTAYFGDFDGNVYSVNVQTGALTWALDLDKGAVRGAPVVSRGLLIVGTEDGWFVGIEPSTHAIRWQTKLDTAVTADLALAEDGSVLIAPTSCVSLGESEERVYYTGLDPATGELRRALGPVC